MLKKTRFGTLTGSRALRASAAAALMAASIASGAAPAAASASIAAHSRSQGSNVNWALLIERRQASVNAAMHKAGVGPSLAGSASPTGN